MPRHQGGFSRIRVKAPVQSTYRGTNIPNGLSESHNLGKLITTRDQTGQGWVRQPGGAFSLLLYCNKFLFSFLMISACIIACISGVYNSLHKCQYITN